MTQKATQTTKWVGVVVVSDIENVGGAKRDRTADLYNAIVAVRSRGKILFDIKNP